MVEEEYWHRLEKELSMGIILLNVTAWLQSGLASALRKAEAKKTANTVITDPDIDIGHED